MRSLSLDQLRAFSAVAELGSFSVAAERLNLSQPAISVQISALERRFGVRLLERLGRQVAPTAAGARLLPHVRRIDEAVNDALAAIADARQEVSGRVRVGTGATACIYLLPLALRQLRRDFPGVEIVVRTGNTGDLLHDLQENRLDVAVVTLPAGGRSLAAEPLLEDEIIAVFPPGLKPLDPATAVDLAALPLLLYEPGGNTRRIIDAWFERAGVAPRPAMELGSVEAIKQLVGAGLGCALLPRLALGADRDRLPSGVTISRLFPPLNRQLGMTLRRDKVPDRALREVIAALRGRAAAAQPGSTSKTTPSRPSRSSSSRLVGTR